MGAGGGGRYPKVLTDFYRNTQIGHDVATEELFSAEGDLDAAYRDGVHSGGRGGEMAQLIKFAVVGNIGFGHDAEQPASAADCRAIIQLVPPTKRQTNHGEKCTVSRGGEIIAHRSLCRSQQRAREEEIRAGVGRDAELREGEQLDAAGCGCARDAHQFCRVVGAVCDTDGRRCCCRANKSVFHLDSSFPKLGLQHIYYSLIFAKIQQEDGKFSSAKACNSRKFVVN